MDGPDAITEKIRDKNKNKNKNRFNSRQVVRSNPFTSKEARSGGKSRQQIMTHHQLLSRSIYLA